MGRSFKIISIPFEVVARKLLDVFCFFVAIVVVVVVVIIIIFIIIICVAGEMGVTMKQTALAVAALGVLSFVFGVIAENKKPAAGVPISGKGVVICKYPSDPTVALGYLSALFLIASTIAGYMSLFYPYKGKSIPYSALFRNTNFTVFFNIAVGTAGLAIAFLLWPTITEQLHASRNVHHNLETSCPTAKTGLLGGGAFLSLDSTLFWLIALMLASNAREDFFEDGEGGEPKEEFGQIHSDDYIKGSA